MQPFRQWEYSSWYSWASCSLPDTMDSTCRVFTKCNYKVFFQVWVTKKNIIERNSLARNIDVDFLFDISWDHYFMSLCQHLKDKNYTNLSMKVFQGLRSANQFKLFVMLNLSCFSINSPTLPHKHSAPSNVETKVVRFSMKIF